MGEDVGAVASEVSLLFELSEKGEADGKEEDTLNHNGSVILEGISG